MTDADDKRLKQLSEALLVKLGDRSHAVVEKIIADAQTDQPTVADTWRKIADAMRRRTPPAT